MKGLGKLKELMSGLTNHNSGSVIGGQTLAVAKPKTLRF